MIPSSQKREKTHHTVQLKSFPVPVHIIQNPPIEAELCRRRMVISTTKTTDMKKTLLMVFMLMGMLSFGFAQSPEAINYQAVVRSNSGVVMANQSLTVKVGIYSDAAGTMLAFEETHSLSTNDYGMLSLKIGQGTLSSGAFASIDWANTQPYIKVEIDDGGGFADLGLHELVTVPYAFHATSADKASDMALGELSDVTATSPSSGQVLSWNGTNWEAATPTASPWMTNGNNLYYDQGYVGVGTSTPGAGLTVQSAAGYGSAVGLKNTGGGQEWRMTSWTDGTFRLLKTSGSTFSAMVVEPVDGKIGIGTSLPDQQLSVHTNSGISYIRVSDNTTGPASGLRMGMSGSGNAYIINDEALKNLYLGTDGTSQVAIKDNGYVGINELAPDQVLHIKQINSNRGVRIEHNSTADFWENGIGVTTKNYKFYYNNLFRADISSVDGAYTQSSDRRLKRDITYMTPVLDRVKQLKPATYHYIDNNDNDPRSTGFVAQEVEPIFPNLVRDTDEGYKGLVYDGFAVISIKAIQELNEKVEAMQKEIDALKANPSNR